MNLPETIITFIGALFVYTWLLQWMFKVNRIVELLARIELHLSDKAQQRILDKIKANREFELPAVDRELIALGCCS
jgi:hypothetical protein